MRRLRTALASLALLPVLAGSTFVLAPQPATGVRDHIASFLTKRVGGPSATRPPAPFDRSDPPLVRIAAAGDVGTGGRTELATAAAMARAGGRHPFDALVLLGDNVYPSGDPSRLGATVFRPFAPVLERGADLLPVLGNHDVETGGGEDQVEALGMPGRWYAQRKGPVLIVALDSTRAGDPAQRRWLEATLARSTAPWKIAVMHFPPYSAGWHGSHAETRAAFSGLFERFGVQLVLSGHDHDYQRSKPVRDVTYVVSGGAAKLRRTGRADFTAVAASTHHFVDIAVWRDRLTLRPIDQTGRTFDQVTLTP